MDAKEVAIPIHHHFVTPSKDERVGICDGYSCTECDFYAHKTCSNPPREINYPSHKCCNTLFLTYSNESSRERCDLCGGKIVGDIKLYGCNSCDLNLHLECAKYPLPETIDVPQNHDHKLRLEKRQTSFTCAACGKDGDGYPYKCQECDLRFHVNCRKYAAEVNHPSHSLHPLKLFKGEPLAYIDGKCRLCEEKLINYEVYYHCSTCNFCLDLHCALDPPPLHIHNLNTHDHELTLMPKMISFTCTTCGLKGDRSPYVCLPCDFTAHNDCSGFPWVININRHNHRVSRTSLIGVVNAVCGVCQKKMDWSCGGYSCQKCDKSAFHTKCATREDVTDGRELKDEPEEDEDIEPFEVIDANTMTIRHVNHRHNLRLDKSGIFIEERGSCEACAYPIYRDSFYSCMSCSFILHESCANLPTRRWHVLNNTPYTLQGPPGNYFKCPACEVIYNGFQYYTYPCGIDVRCGSVSEPFFHQSHLDHPLFYTSPKGVCSACKKEAHFVLRCVDGDCGYILDFKCALLPYEVKHRVDDHFLSLCYSEKDASGKYWCDICEKETDLNTWFYTCKDYGVTLHTNCVLGDFRGLRPGSTVSTNHFYSQYYDVVRNNSMSRPLCSRCKFHCKFPVILKLYDHYSISNVYFCSIDCCDMKYRTSYN